MKRTHSLLAIAIAFSLTVPGSLTAQEGHGAPVESEGAESEEAGSEEHGEAHGEEHEFKNSVAIFLGTTQAEREHGERDDPQFTIGFDYERILTKHFGVGGILDFVVEGHREAIVAAAAAFHAGPAKFVLAPGGERVRDSGDWEGIVRFGFMWSFPAGKIHLEPSLFYDVTGEGGTWVGGLTIGKEF